MDLKEDRIQLYFAVFFFFQFPHLNFLHKNGNERDLAYRSQSIGKNYNAKEILATSV